MYNSSNSRAHLVLTGEFCILHKFLRNEHHCNFIESQGAFNTFVTLQLKSLIEVSIRQNY